MKKLFLFGAIALLLATVGCGDDEKKVEQETRLSIIGTWKCIGFGTTDNNKIKEIEPKDCTECYTITFKEDGKFNGHSSTNEVFGKYDYNLSTSKFTFSSWGGTEVGEVGDGYSYTEVMTKVSSYNISENNLTLKSADNKVLFKLKGGKCEYRDIFGKAIITSIENAPVDAYNCPNNPKEIRFRFIPQDGITEADYLYPNREDISYIKIHSGMNPSEDWLKSNGISISKEFKCIRREITNGTCTPVIFKFIEINLNPENYCN